MLTVHAQLTLIGFDQVDTIGSIKVSSYFSLRSSCPNLPLHLFVGRAKSAASKAR
jgi:hypothetical protein